MIWQTFIAFETIIWSGLRSWFSKWVPFCQIQLQILLVSASAKTNIAKTVDKSKWDQEKPEHRDGSNYWCKGWSVSKKSNGRVWLPGVPGREWNDSGELWREHSVVGPMNPPLLWTTLVQCPCCKAVLCATTEAWLRMENHLTGVLNETQDVLLAKQSSYKISVISDEFV